MAVVLGWIIAAFTCAYVANEKNRNVGLWAVLGACFGLFTLLVLVFLPKLEKSVITATHPQDQIEPSQDYRHTAKSDDGFSPEELI